MFSLHGLTELAKALAKALLLTAVLIGLLWNFRGEAAALAAAGTLPGLSQAGTLLLQAFLALVAAMALLAALDVPLQLWRYRSKLRMTLEEVKEEARETEGDPQLRMRVRSRQRDMARRRMMAAVPQADVVVTNPTHYAVALSYREGGMRAPQVVAKGAGLVAQRIREIAEEHRVPTLEAAPLARALYRHAEVGDEVPAALYNAVAQVLAYVYRLRHQASRGGAAPQPPHAIDVPAGMDPAA
jgi:flagellar biosynthetic protein FlhB